MTTDNVCFLDTETTGLDPDRHAIWEVALIIPDRAEEHVWQFPVDEMTADPFALNIGRYWERAWPTDTHTGPFSGIDAIYSAENKAKSRNAKGVGRAIKPGRDWCQHFRDLTAGRHLIGAVVSFDEERLRRLLHRNGVLHRWHYHLIDVEALAAGYTSARCEGEGLDGTRGTVGVRCADGTLNHLDGRPPWNSSDLSPPAQPGRTSGPCGVR